MWSGYGGGVVVDECTCCWAFDESAYDA